MTTTHTIDATGKTLGRTASNVAKILIGKSSASFERNKIAATKVSLINVSKAKIDPKKLGTKIYTRYSGYPGGKTDEKMSRVIEKKGYSEIFKNAVYGMIPANKLRDKIMKNLIISE